MNKERLQLALDRLNYETNGYGGGICYAVAVYDKYGVIQPSPTKYPMKEEDVQVLQDAINKLEEYEKYIPDIEDLKDWCKGDCLQEEGAKLKEKATKC